MAVFTVTISGRIQGLEHRFTGGGGKAERYQTQNPQEIAILKNCRYATRRKDLEKAEADDAAKAEEEVWEAQADEGTDQDNSFEEKLREYLGTVDYNSVLKPKYHKCLKEGMEPAPTMQKADLVDAVVAFAMKRGREAAHEAHGGEPRAVGDTLSDRLDSHKLPEV